MKNRILVVDDEKEIADLVEICLLYTSDAADEL